MRDRRDRLFGVLNGIDLDEFDPATDRYLGTNYTPESLDQRVQNKLSLQREAGLRQDPDTPVVGLIARLTDQKGLDLITPIVEDLLQFAGVQFVLLGTGESRYEHELGARAAAHPGAMAVVLAYNETLAHRIEAAADIFLMPSLFEPCGLNQLYSLRYGTPPLVRAVGGLADTVVDANAENLAAGTATGFVFGAPESGALIDTVRRAVGLWRDRDSWEKIQAAAMQQDFSWQQSARHYLELYRSGND